MSRSRTPRSGDVKPCPCGEGRPEAMTRRGPSRGHCYECTKTRNGRERSTEEHHPFGRDNPAVEKITVEVPGNWHRALDARRARLPEILKRPGDNPLHRIAAVVARLGQAADAFSDFTRRELWPAWAANLADLFAEGAHAAADWLLILAGKLDEHFGPGWVDLMDMPPWPL
jgi:hypothetical protein